MRTPGWGDPSWIPHAEQHIVLGIYHLLNGNGCLNSGLSIGERPFGVRAFCHPRVRERAITQT